VEGAVQVWDARTGNRINTLGSHDREIRAVVFSPNGKLFATASGDGEVKLWDANRLNAKQAPRILHARVPGPSVNIAFSPDSRRLATGEGENAVKIWDVETCEGTDILRGHIGDVYAVAYSIGVEGRWLLASGGEDSTVKVWDGRSGKLLHSFSGHTGLISSLAFSPDGKRLYSGSRDKTVKIWDVSKLGEKN
jgi:WD40 repeat protein